LSLSRQPRRADDVALLAAESVRDINDSAIAQYLVRSGENYARYCAALDDLGAAQHRSPPHVPYMATT